jgi:hypothetical protein
MPNVRTTDDDITDPNPEDVPSPDPGDLEHDDTQTRVAIGTFVWL